MPVRCQSGDHYALAPDSGSESRHMHGDVLSLILETLQFRAVSKHTVSDSNAAQGPGIGRRVRKFTPRLQPSHLGSNLLQPVLCLSPTALNPRHSVKHR